MVAKDAPDSTTKESGEGKWHSRMGSNYKKYFIITAVIFAILMVSSIVFSMMYISEASKVADRDEEISSLIDEIETGLYLNQRETIDDVGDQAIEPIDDDDDAVSVAAAASCDGGSSYSANIGKFDLDLNSPRVIVRSLDGGFEGGPITSLEVGTCVSGENNVVQTPAGSVHSILAHPASSSADLKASYEGQNGVTLNANGTTTIDGVTAQLYFIDTLFRVDFAYFDNNGIGYEIQYTDSSMFTDITSDWNFTP